MIRNLLLVIGSTLFALFVGLAVWFWIAPQKSKEDLPGYADLVDYDPGRSGGHLKPNMDALVQGERIGEPVRWITNSQGFRNAHEVPAQAEPGVYRILFYGDSFVDGMRTGQQDTIGGQLESLLNASLESNGDSWRSVEVLISGHNNPANAWYHWQQHGHQLQPNLVILGLTLGNDITWHNLGGGVMPQAGRQGLTLSLLEGAGMSDVGYPELRVPDSAFRERGWLALRWRDLRLGLRRFLAPRFYTAADWLPPLMGPFKASPGVVPAAGPFVALGLFLIQGQVEIERLWEDLALTLDGLNHDVQAHNTPLLIVPFPVRIQLDPEDWRSLVDAYDLDHRVFTLELPNQRLSDLCDRIDAWCSDPRKFMQRAAVRESLYRPLGDMHLNKAGQALLANYVFDQIKSLDLPTFQASETEAYQRLTRKLSSWQHHRRLERFPWLDGNDGPIRLDAASKRNALRRILMTGWHVQDEGAIWSSADFAYMDLPIIWPGKTMKVEISMMPFVEPERLPKQNISVWAQGKLVAEWSLLHRDFQWHCLVIEDHADWLSRLQWRLPNATSPASIGVATDRRKLAIALSAIRLSLATSDNSCELDSGDTRQNALLDP